MEPLNASDPGAAIAGEEGTRRPLPVVRTPAPVARPLANTSRRLEAGASKAAAVGAQRHTDARKRDRRHLIVAKSNLENDVFSDAGDVMESSTE